MTHDCICNWLGLPGEAWPPDHYRLLGLPPGEGDAARIEQQVHDRLEAVRHYQLLHPEHATEAMNRLAQAFVCLTDPEAKKAYDAKLFQPSPAPQIQETIEELPVPESPDPLAWLYRRQQATRAVTQLEIPAFEDGPLLENPPAQEESGDSELPGPELAITERPDLIPPPIRRPPAEVAQKKDTILEAAHTALPARRMLGTKRAFYHRVARTRQLVRAWSEAGEYLGHPGRRLAKPIEATDLIHALITLRTELKSFPPLLGQAGQPGYLVVALARQQVIVPTFQTLLPSQREALARDWRAGLKLLHAHLQVLREELRAMRYRGLFSRTIRAVNSLLHSHLGLVILFVGFLAVVLAAWRSFRPEAIEQPAQPAPEAPRQVSVGPFARSIWNVRQQEPRKEPAKVPLKPEPAGTIPESPPPKDNVPSAPTKVDEPTSDKKAPTENIRRFQAEDRLYCIRSVAFLSNGRFVCCNGQSRLLLWDISSGKSDVVSKFPDHLTSLAVCANTGVLACGDETGQICLAHEEAGVKWIVQPVEKKHSDTINALAFSADGKWLISCGQDGKILLWDVDTGKLDRTLAELRIPVHAVGLAADGSRACAGDDSGVVHVWDLKNGGKETRSVHAKAVTSLALTKDGRVLFSGGLDGAVWRWDLHAMKNGTKQGEASGAVESLALSADGRFLFSGDLSGTVKQWNVERSIDARALSGADDLVYSLAISPDGKWILSGQAAGKLVLLPLELEPNAK